VLSFGAGSAPWPALNDDGSALSSGEPAFDVYRVGILDSYSYFVDEDFVLRRVGANTGLAGEPVAVNIGSLQVDMGLDNDGDGDVDLWSPTITAAQVAAANLVAMQIGVFGRTPFNVPNWNEPAATFAGFDLPIAQVNRAAKWRRMQVSASLRNFIL
jgi:hypothetical protein